MEDRPDRLAELRASARGWNGIQLAVLGFIGLCGVLTDPASPDPMWLQVLAGVVALAALVLACAATFLVGRVAWPLYGGEGGRPDDLARAGRRLRRGLALTFAAVALIALAAASSWWPEEDAGGGGTAAAVEVRTAAGQSACGTLADGREGTLALTASGRSVEVPLRALAAVRPVGGCP